MNLLPRTSYQWIIKKLTMPTTFLGGKTVLKISSRNTHVLERRVKLPIFPPGTDLNNKFRSLDPVYDELLLTRDENAIPKPFIKIILTQYVEDVGKPGQIVEMNPLEAYDLIVLGDAMYATPYNISRAEVLSKDQIDEYSTLSAFKTMKKLRKMPLTVFVNMDEPWKIEPWIIRVNYRLKNVQILDDSCIEVPETPIIGPNMDYEGKDFACYITINNRERFPVRCRVRHYTKMFTQRVILSDDHEYSPAEVILPEQADLIKSIREQESYSPETIAAAASQESTKKKKILKVKKNKKNK